MCVVLIFYLENGCAEGYQHFLYMESMTGSHHTAVQRMVLWLTLLEDRLACLGLLRAHLDCRSCERTWCERGEGETRELLLQNSCFVVQAGRLHPANRIAFMNKCNMFRCQQCQHTRHERA